MENKYDWLNKRSIRSVDQLRLWSDNPRLKLDEKTSNNKRFYRRFNSR